MKRYFIIIFLFLSILLLQDCAFYHIIRPLRLYDLDNGNLIEVLIHPDSPTSQHSGSFGKMTSLQHEEEQYTGEYVLFSNNQRWDEVRTGALQMLHSFRDSYPPEFAKLYGYGENSKARPVGTGILVNKNGSVIEIIFYNISNDYQSGDGIARDNHGKYYRVFLSSETREY